MFKKDDYIVLLRCKYGSNFQYTYNFCYKQIEKNEVLRTYLDSEGNKSNGWDIYSFDKGYGNNDCDWRYATHEEIQEYDRLGKPFDTTLLTPPLYEIY